MTLNTLEELLEKVTDMMYPFNVYAVGGCVRDYIMNNPPHDYDFTTNAKPDEIESKIKSAGRRAYLTGKRYGTIGCKIDGHMIEITTFRGERYEPNCRKPKVEYLNSLNADLDRRDFTVNAMAIRFNKNKNKLHIIDNYGGQEDIRHKIIKCVGNSKIRFKEDPLRILRGIRLATKLKFKIEEKTSDRMTKMSNLLLTISKERWMQELDRILMDDNVEWGLIELWGTNCFRYMIPELHLQMNYDQNSKYHSHELWFHTNYVVGAVPKEINIRWGALLHDIGKPFVQVLNTKTGYFNYINHELIGADMVEKLGRHLHWSNERRNAVKELVLNHLKEDSPLKKYDNMMK